MQREGETEKIERTSIHWFIPLMSVKGKVRNQPFLLGLLCEMKGPKYFDNFLMLFLDNYAKAKSKVREPGHELALTWDASITQFRVFMKLSNYAFFHIIVF